MNKGVLYVGTNPDYFTQAAESARSLRKYNDIPVSILTSNCAMDYTTPSEADVFNECIEVSEVYDDVRDKVYNLSETPFEKTVYLDGDTTIVGDITPIFDLLDRVDIAASRAPKHPLISVPGVPDSFPELNTGVIGYNYTPAVEEVFKSWERNLREQMEQGRPNSEVPVLEGDCLEDISSFGRKHGQPPFREALFNSQIGFSILPSEYNFRGDGAYAFGEVKIIHMKNRYWLEPIINNNYGARIYWNSKLLIKNGRSHNFNPPTIGKINEYLPLRKIARATGTEAIADQIYNWMQSRYSNNDQG